MMWSATAVHRLLATILALCALAPASAAADQRPPGCVSNSVSVAFTRDRATVRPGQTVTYTVSVGNVGGGACDVSDATVTFTPPGGTAVPLAEHLDLPAGTPPATVARPQWTVPAGRAAGDAVATTSVSGVLHDAPVDHTAAVTKTLGTLVVDPKVSLTLSATPDTGTAPLTVTYHYRLKNVSNPPDGVIDPEIDHPACDDIRYASGDAGVIDTIDGNETWEFTCTRVFDRGGTYSASAAVAATSLSDGEDVVAVTPLTTVTVNPPAPTGHLTLQKVASPASGIAPRPVTFTSTVGNDGPVPISGFTVADGGCAPVTTASPDTPLAPGASRGFACNATFGVGT